MRPISRRQIKFCSFQYNRPRGCSIEPIAILPYTGFSNRDPTWIVWKLNIPRAVNNGREIDVGIFRDFFVSIQCVSADNVGIHFIICAFRP